MQAIFSRPGFLDEMCHYADSLSENKTALCNFIQGDLWLNEYKIEVSKKLIFPIYAYFDEFEVRNPLASHAGEEKLGGIHVSLATLPPQWQGKLENIFVSTIVHSKYMKKFGNKAIFQKLIEDINFLSNEGIEVNVDGIMKRIYFQCVLILGDNLGINVICGFSESFSANHYLSILLRF